MKAFGKEVTFPKMFAEDKKPKKKMSSQEIGGTGTFIFGGIVSGEEYLPELQPRQALVIYDRMRKGDATVAAALLVCKLPILGAKWFVEPASSEPEHRMQADFVEKALMEFNETGWQDFIRQALLMLDFGYMVFEKVFQVSEYEYDDPGNPLKEVKPYKVAKREYITWKKFASRLPKSIYRWEMSADPVSKKARPGITQILPQGGTPETPAEKLLYFINNKEGDNYNGVSILRQAYKHWYYKDTYYKIDAIGFERQSVGIPTMKLPDGFDEGDKKKAEEVLQNIRANEKSYLAYPASWEFEFADMKGHTLKDPTAAIEHHDNLILKSVLAQFLNLASTKGGGGSRALSADHSEIFFEALKSVARQICEVMNNHAIKQLIDLNFDNVTEYPKLSFAKIGKIDWTSYGAALASLTSAGLLTPDHVLEEYLREQMELPDMADPVDYDTEGVDVVEEEGKPVPAKPKEQPQGKIKVDPANLKKDNPEEDDQEAPNKKPQGEEKRTQVKAGEVKKKSSDRLQLSEDDVFVSWRPLTFAEQKVNFQHIQHRITEIEDKFKRDAKDVLTQAIEPLIDEFLQHVADKNMDGVKDLTLPYKTAYGQCVLKYLKIPYELGKKMCSAEMKMMPPATPQKEADRMKMQADMIVDLHENDLIKAMKLKAINALKKRQATEPATFAAKRKNLDPNGTDNVPDYTPAEEAVAVAYADPFEEAMAAMSSDLADVIDTITENTANVTTGMLFNQGRGLAQEVNADQIYALQRSEVLDEKCCDFCLSMDGLIVAKDDPAAEEDEYHSSCFVAGTKVLTQIGEKNIEDVKVGEIVATHKDNWQEVYHTMARKYEGDIIEIKLENDKIIRCTPNHKFWINGEWIEARDISVKDDIHASTLHEQQNGNEMKIKTINVVPFCGIVYNMGVLYDESYVVEGVRVANCRGMWVEIMNDEAELPEITGVPEEVSQYYGGLNDIKKMPDGPILREDSPAHSYVKTGDFKK